MKKTLLGVWSALTSTLLFNCLRIAAVLIILLVAVFSIAPQSAYITIEEKPSELNIDDCRINMLSWTDGDLVFKDFTEIRFTPYDQWTLNVNGQEFEHCTAVIRLTDPSGYCTVYKPTIADSLQCTVSNALPEELLELAGVEASAEQIERFLGRQSLRMRESGTLQMSGVREYGVTCTQLLIGPFGAAVEIYDENDKKVCSFSASESGIVKIANCMGVSIECNTGYALATGYRNLEGLISDMERIRMKGTGKIHFQYAAETKALTTTEQAVEIASRANGIGMKLGHTGEAVSVTATGFVNEAALSGINLFPDFISWLRGNVWVLSSSILSIIGGAISLMGKRK